MYPVSSKLALSLQSTKLIEKPSLVQILPRVNRLSQTIQVEEGTLTKWRSYSMQTKESFSLSRITDKRRDSLAITDYIIILLIIHSIGLAVGDCSSYFSTKISFFFSTLNTIFLCIVSSHICAYLKLLSSFETPIKSNILEVRSGE